MLDWDLNKKIPISAAELSDAIACAMKTEPFASMANEIGGIEESFHLVQE